MEVNCNIKKYTVCIPTTIRQWSERKEQHEAKTQIKSEAKNSSACRANSSTVQFPHVHAWPGRAINQQNIAMLCRDTKWKWNTHTLLGNGPTMRTYFPTEKSHPKASEVILLRSC